MPATTTRYAELQSRFRELATELLAIAAEAKALEKDSRDGSQSVTGFATKAMPQHSVDTLSAWLES